MQKKRLALPHSANAVHKTKRNIQHHLNGAHGAAVTHISSMRLTKDVDLVDWADGVSTASVQSNVKRALQYAAQSVGLRGAEVDPGKSTETTVRMRLSGTVSAALVRFVVEVSGPNPVPKNCQARVQVTQSKIQALCDCGATWRKGGMAWAHCAIALGQRVRNTQPDG